MQWLYVHTHACKHTCALASTCTCRDTCMHYAGAYSYIPFSLHGSVHMATRYTPSSLSDQVLHYIVVTSTARHLMRAGLIRLHCKDNHQHCKATDTCCPCLAPRTSHAVQLHAYTELRSRRMQLGRATTHVPCAGGPRTTTGIKAHCRDSSPRGTDTHMQCLGPA